MLNVHQTTHYLEARLCVMVFGISYEHAQSRLIKEVFDCAWDHLWNRHGPPNNKQQETCATRVVCLILACPSFLTWLRNQMLYHPLLLFRPNHLKTTTRCLDNIKHQESWPRRDQLAGVFLLPNFVRNQWERCRPSPAIYLVVQEVWPPPGPPFNLDASVELHDISKPGPNRPPPM